LSLIIWSLYWFFGFATLSVNFWIFLIDYMAALSLSFPWYFFKLPTS
jgi:hypothetical protein